MLRRSWSGSGAWPGGHSGSTERAISANLFSSSFRAKRYLRKKISMLIYFVDLTSIFHSSLTRCIDMLMGGEEEDRNNCEKKEREKTEGKSQGSGKMYEK